jgi:hypothetical protein
MIGDAVGTELAANNWNLTGGERVRFWDYEYNNNWDMDGGDGGVVRDYVVDK